MIKKIKRFGLALVAFAGMPTTVFGQWVGNGGVGGFANAGSTGLPVATIYNIISNTLSWLLAVLGFIAITGFVISGIQYLTAAGDEGQIDTAKTNMKYSIIGVIVGLMGFVAVSAIDSWLAASASF